jgi:TetR/AcrR family transcriptional regulator, cholesterol catabolism regulator
MPKGIPLTAEELSRKRHEIFSAAVDLFLERGFFETSMRELAEAAGMSKSSLYDYFHTKDDILIWYFLDDTDDLIDFAQDIISQPLSATEKIHQIMHMQMERMLENKGFFLKFYLELQRLGGESRQRILSKRQTYQALLCSIIEQGIQEGVFRTINPLLATHMLIMTMMPATFTSSPINSPEEMIDEALDLFLRGIKADRKGI